MHGVDERTSGVGGGGRELPGRGHGTHGVRPPVVAFDLPETRVLIEGAPYAKAGDVRSAGHHDGALLSPDSQPNAVPAQRNYFQPALT